MLSLLLNVVLSSYVAYLVSRKSARGKFRVVQSPQGRALALCADVDCVRKRGWKAAESTCVPALVFLGRLSRKGDRPNARTIS